jgi:hypothetical protein
VVVFSGDRKYNTRKLPAVGFLCITLSIVAKLAGAQKKGEDAQSRQNMRDFQFRNRNIMGLGTATARGASKCHTIFPVVSKWTNSFLLEVARK